MERMTAWRFLSPPTTFMEGVAVGPSGRRITNEDLYGATFSEAMIVDHQGRGFLFLDSKQWRRARKQVREQTLPFQLASSAYLFLRGHHKAGTIEELAAKLGVPADVALATISEYNEGIQSAAGDPFHKDPEICSPVKEAPFYAIDISIKNSALNPAAGLTLGGLRVNEDTGQVLDEAGASIEGIYAAGRNAVGICSNSYVSGLSLGDCVFSGRRAGKHAAEWVKGNLSPAQQ
jgi:3-oxo-5alpha-steroid 4-dehydrogenase